MQKQAVLVAGMHRSGTSALTRVLSLLGADLPRNIAPPLLNNNETGFWESVDLMILHDELLASAGSFWSDWTEFNPDWYHSAVADKFRKKLRNVLEHDFAKSSLFVVKDPRVCRFLPLWLELLSDLDIKPLLVLPVRNPLEVALSLHKRDGLALATGGLLWLRHVLDVIYFARDLPIAFLTYDHLMSDWKGAIGSISTQIGLHLPRRSVSSELDIERYLDVRQRHNVTGVAELRGHTEFLPVVVEVYVALLELASAPGTRVQVQDKLLDLRLQFNADSSFYGKALHAELAACDAVWIARHEKQLLHADQAKQQATQQAKQQIAELVAAGAKRHRELIHDYEIQLDTQRRRHFELEGEVANCEQRLRRVTYNNKQLRSQLVEVLERKPPTVGYASANVRVRHDPPSRADLRKAEQQMKLLSGSILFDEHFYRAQCADLSIQDSAVQHYYFFGAYAGFDPHPLFRSRWYLDQNRDVKELSQNPLLHFLQDGWKEARSPHPLFDLSWYMGTYTDIRLSGVNPLLHYLEQGGRELRSPHPLFDAAYYVERYPDALAGGLTPLVHYLKYGAGWACDPHPLFDTPVFLENWKGAMPIGMSPLELFLSSTKAWYVPIHAAFDATWYRRQYPDVDGETINPLLHFVLNGELDQRKPHPEVFEDHYQQQFSSLFKRLKIFGVVKVVPPDMESASPPPPFQIEQSITRCFDSQATFQSLELMPDDQVFSQNQLTIHWVTCDFARSGGGGNMTIFRFVRLFELFGHKQKVWLHNRIVHESTGQAYEDMVRYYQQSSASIGFVDEEGFSDAAGDIIIATDWESVWPVLSAQRFKRRFYFVQDYEPAFFAAGGHSLAAESTYHEDLDCICAGLWLEQLMRVKYGRWSTRFWLAADRQVYFPPADAVCNDVLRVAFYARLSTSRRAVELGIVALDLLAKQGAGFHVEVYGSEDIERHLQHVSFAYTSHGVLGDVELANLYRQCDVGIVFSATNYSLVPQEMMACGLAVLELDGDNTRSVFPSGGVVLTKPHPRDVAMQLRCLLDDASYRKSVATIGYQWASQFDWESTAREVSDVIQERLLELGFRKNVVLLDKPKVSVVIPVLNGGELLERVLDAVLAQKAPWPFEVLVIDSGSSDGSVEAVEERTNVRLHQISQTEFSHGGTRNLGVELTNGEYIAFLTQDALPVDAFWLFHLVSMLEHDPSAAGVFGRHIPYPTASPFMQRDLHAHFDNLAKYPLYLNRETNCELFDSGDQKWRQLLHFYSDNNSCLRRSVWLHVPYPVIDYGEDQVWADRIIRVGYTKAYALNATVYHSHDYNEEETFERSKVEAKFFRRQFGYIFLKDEDAFRRELDSINKRDRLFAQDHGLSKAIVDWQLKLNSARLNGYLAGSSGC